MAKFNPFNPNSIVTPALFAGRTQQVKHIMTRLEHVKRGMSASFVLHGDRGIGKTALAKLIKYIASARNPKIHDLNFLTSYYAVDRDQTLESVLQESLNALTDQLPSSALTRLSERVGTIFKGGKFSFGSFSLSLPGAPTKEESLATKRLLKDQVVSVLTNILKSLDDGAQSEKPTLNADGILIVIDEVHNLQDLEGAAQVLRAISTTLDVAEIGKVSFLVIGYTGPVVDFFAGDPSAQRHFDTIPLGIMPKNEAKAVLEKGFKEAQVEHDAAALDQHILSTGGYPHAIQVLGKHLLEVDTDERIDEDDWQRATFQTAEELKAKDFSSLYNFNRKPTIREKIMDVLAIIGHPVTKQEIAHHCGKTIYQPTYIGELKKTGAVREEVETGLVSLQSPLFRFAILLHIMPKLQKGGEYADLAEHFYRSPIEDRPRIEIGDSSESKDKKS